jgi:hypothetical protein
VSDGLVKIPKFGSTCEVAWMGISVNPPSSGMSAVVKASDCMVTD